MNKNPLEDLLVDDEEGAKMYLEILSTTLKDFCRLNKNSKNFEFLPSFHTALNNEDKILIVLAASKARYELFKVEESLSPIEIINLKIMPEGSVKGTLKRLTDIGEIKSEKGRYLLPNYRIANLSARFSSGSSM